MEEKMSLSDALRVIVRKIGDIRVPVREVEISSALNDVANNIYECITAIENAEQKEETNDGSEVNDNV